MGTMASTSKRASPAQNLARRKRQATPILIRAVFKSRLEDRIAGQIEDEGLPVQYEPHKLKYAIPARTATYTPDFLLGRSIYIESKGWFQAKDRKLLVLVKETHPELDIRLLFDGNARTKKIHKLSPTTYAKWCDDHGFVWADGGVIPETWLQEAKEQLKEQANHVLQ